MKMSECGSFNFVMEKTNTRSLPKRRRLKNKSARKRKMKLSEGFNKERKWMEKRGFEYIGTIDNFQIPKWWECNWRRIPCGEDDCRLCGKIKKDRKRHVLRGEDPDSIKSVFEDVGNSLGEALAMIKQHAAEMGIDITNINEREFKEPPEPDEFPLYERTLSWRELLYETLAIEGLVVEDKEPDETVKDLLWYSNTLIAKTYRQLCNRWHIKQKVGEGEFDYKYTKYVLGECLKILQSSLLAVIAQEAEIDGSSANSFSFLCRQLSVLEKSILTI